jgi:hypothetical protein
MSSKPVIAFLIVEGQHDPDAVETVLFSFQETGPEHSRRYIYQGTLRSDKFAWKLAE